jgi:tight adherence protein B
MGVATSGALAVRALRAREATRVSARLGVSLDPTRVARRGLPAIGLTFLGIVLGAIAGYRLAGPVGACTGVALAAITRRARARARERRRRADLEQGTVEIATALATAVRAGRSIRRSLEEALRESSETLRPIVRQAVDDLRMGQSLPGALSTIREGLPIPEADLLVSVLEIHRRVGGELPAALDHVADLIVRRVRARRRLRALSAQGRASGAVLAVLPAAFVGLLSGTSGNGLGVFYRTPVGSLLLIAGLACTGLGLLWIRAILRRAEP